MLSTNTKRGDVISDNSNLFVVTEVLNNSLIINEYSVLRGAIKGVTEAITKESIHYFNTKLTYKL